MQNIDCHGGILLNAYVEDMKDIFIVNPGLLTTVQDKGRWGYQEFGMPVAGAMDEYSLRAANILVGNDEYAAALETTLLGPEIRFNTDTVIAITGANMMPRVNGRVVPMWRTLRLAAGDLLSFEMAREGARGYIAFAGGIDVPAIMGSRSTYVRGSIGGYEGRKLKANDEFGLGRVTVPLEKLLGRIVPGSHIPEYKNQVVVRAVLGPQDDCFTDASVELFFNSVYEVTNEADRMGYRLAGAALEHKNGADIISDGINLGSIQIPGHGMPIVMMSERQTTGGYTKIATVISTDISVMAQLKPGDKIQFIKTEINEAHEIYRDYEERIVKLKEYVKTSHFVPKHTKYFNIKTEGIGYEVMVEELDKSCSDMECSKVSADFTPPEELIAVITAAVQAMSETGTGMVVRSIGKPSNELSKWVLSGWLRHGAI